MVFLEDSFRLTPLLAVPNKKPLDLGCGRLSASISTNGDILSLNGYHPQVGFVTLAPIAQFPNDQFYNSDFVRQYRSRLIDLFNTQGRSFGLRIQGEVQDQAWHLVERSAPFLRSTLGALVVSSLFLALDVDHYAVLINQVEIHNTGEEEAVFDYDFGGTLSMNRTSYGQITEAGPIPMPPAENALVVRGNHLTVKNRHLPARADIFLFKDSQPLLLSATAKTAASPIDYTYAGKILLAKGETCLLSIVYALTSGEQEPFIPDSALVGEWIERAKASLPKWKTRHEETADFIIQRNIDYILSCCVIPTTDEHTCIVTDHQILPLSWNRDIYYMIQLLFAAERQVAHLIEDAQQQAWREKVQHVLKGHLLWTFEIAERPHRYWGRAYLTTGYCKDEVFQLDQQCYPLLELCDYVARFHDASLVKRVQSQLNDILMMLLEHRHEQKYLFMTKETPADDHVAHPYHFSSHVLLWWTFHQLAHLNSSVPFTTIDLESWAEQVRRDCLEVFPTSYMGKTIFAYLTDLQEHYQLYHDANDLPTLYAPLWGFCRSDDQVWQQTIQFALSTHNVGGFYPGAFGGIGSVHAPHPWPLGDGQELLYARIQHDSERYEQVLQKLTRIVQWDGLFSESIDAKTGQVATRHWFSWPGAFVSTILLDAHQNPLTS